MRKAHEEVGARVTDLRHYGRQSGDIVPQPGEIEDARWFPFDALATSVRGAGSP